MGDASRADGLRGVGFDSRRPLSLEVRHVSQHNPACAWVHAHRIARRHCDHRDTDRIAAAAVQKVREAADEASQFPNLKPVASDLIGLLDVESPLVGALLQTEVLLPAVQDTQMPPDPNQVARILEQVQSGEASLRSDLHALKNPASSHVPGELEAYLELKHSLQALIDELQQLEAHLRHLLEISQTG